MYGLNAPLPQQGIKETDTKLIYDIDFEYIKGMAESSFLNN